MEVAPFYNCKLIVEYSFAQIFDMESFLLVILYVPSISDRHNVVNDAIIYETCFKLLEIELYKILLSNTRDIVAIGDFNYDVFVRGKQANGREKTDGKLFKNFPKSTV